MAVITDHEPTPTSVHELPPTDQVFHVETHGVDFIPESERWARPRDLGGMWAGASVQVEYFIYGAILMTFGFNFAQALSIIILGNLSYFFLGLCSLQGPDTGTTVFGSNRAAYGPNGNRLIALFNWLTQIGFEVEGLILIVGAALVLTVKAGFGVGDPAKVLFVLLAVGIQFILPFFGHASIVKVLRVLIIPFVVIFAIFLGFSAGHAHLAIKSTAGWPTFMAGLAFTIALSGLGWTECGNDYSRYCPRDSSKKAIVGWVFLGTFVPEVLVMTLGAVVGTFILGVGATQAGAFYPFLHQSAIPSWFVVVFLIFAIVQLFGINSLDMYSSGVTLQAMGIRVKRYQAVIVDTVICLGITYWAVFNASFTHFLTDFVALVIIWIAPWMSIYLVDWALRRWRYVPSELQKTGRDGLYYRHGGIWWPAIIAQLVGMIAATSALSASFLPSWANPVTVHTSGADFSIFMGIAVAGLLYLVLARGGVRRQADRQQELLAAQGLL
ncbi:MAG TPA: cytosine permease [Acidimicrobiales bacterium]|nr:cytosine permease [Acidimicrobiales bacterium]